MLIKQALQHSFKLYFRLVKPYLYKNLDIYLPGEKLKIEPLQTKQNCRHVTFYELNEKMKT